ncbi:DUF3823 domain-containing protein [Oceanobacillus piezotolerans]|uniref:DUF3823 domain-containing protein n=1 Tax=Oceanobacillus piezotolerans TaxID=2448030 RepID=A0A498DB98_9BACI|nr:S8 family serine peptidase [Oceanobacillus piezotolerans]RLL46964.1 DUF3823 domain-containing protein [Oceanobacillus piezotolerans]
MRKVKPFQNRTFSIVLTILMVFSLLTPGLAFANSAGDVTMSVNNTKETAAEKVHANVLKQFKEDDKVTFLVKFAEKADPMKVAEIARKDAEKASLSAYNLEYIQRSAVISELKTVASTSQEKVLAYLEKEEEKGNAANIHPYYIVNGIAVTATKEVAEKIASFTEVEKVLPDEKRQLVTRIDKESIQSKAEGKTKSKTKQNSPQNVEWSVNRIGAPSVWDMGIDGTGIVVANIDTGVEWDHPALMDKYAGYNEITGEVDHTYSFFDPVNGEEEPYDFDGHGTHTMGTMVGSESDGANQVGVAPGAKWIAVQAFSYDGGFDSDLLEAAEWILAPGGDASKAPDVVNNSWSGGPGMDEWYLDAVNAWRAADIFPAFAAGNTDFFNPGGPGSVASPSNYPESFAVGATNRNDNLASFSLQGPSPYDEIKPDVSAPGAGVRSSIPGGEYAVFDGTSMATPAVAGVVALLKQADSSLSVDELENILLETADSKAGTDSKFPDSPNNGYGHGIVDAYAAVSSVTSGLGKIEGIVTTEGEDTTPPEYKHVSPSEIIANSSLRLSIEVRDNISITSVGVSYGDKTLDMEKVSGNHKSAVFAVTIPAEDITGESFTYQFIVNDFGGNTVTTEEYTAKISQPIYFENFQDEPTDWEINSEAKGAPSWNWGAPTSGPKAALTGENVFATNIAGEYNNHEESYLDMPAIQLPEENAFLQIEHWFDIEEFWDFGVLIASTDAGDWEIVGEVTGSSNGWVTEAFDLSAFAGQEVYLSFLFISDESVTYPGWYIDNVAIVDFPIAVGSKSNLASSKVQSSELPLDARVSVLETGRSTSTNPMDGSYSLLHGTGKYTLVAEAYGFQSSEQAVEVVESESTEANFLLEEKEKATVSGTVIDKDTGEPIEGARLLLVEDANVEPVSTDAEGKYDLTGYVGDYTLKVFARDYHSQELEVTLDGDVNLDITLDPYYTVPGGTIGYDDGTAEEGTAFFESGNGWGVKMSLPEGKESAIVTEGYFQFWDEEFPVPGGTEFAVEVWSAGEDGLPSERLAGPFEAQAIRDLAEWTVVDLADHNIQVNGDFYMVYIQTQDGDHAPALASDLDGRNAARSYVYYDGRWEPTFAAEGNYMIRAGVSYGVEDPVIDPALDGLVTNETEITVEGTASPTTITKLLTNEKESGEQEVGKDGRFAIDTELTEGENSLKAISSLRGQEVTESEPVTVTLDTEAPALTIESPIEGTLTNKETVTVEGTVSDDHLDTVTVNSESVAVTDGTYSERVILEAGENAIEVAATDQAGNRTVETVNVTADYDAPAIENITPAEDRHVLPGEEVEVSFTSDAEEGSASFKVQLPAQISTASSASNPMEEVEPGVYRGTWVVPTNTDLQGAVIEVELKDASGNTATAEAPGKLSISSKNLERLYGYLRFDTAIEISKEGWETAETVILTRGDEFADTLAGVPLAEQLDAPILMTPSKELYNGIKEEIERLGAKNVIILGGPVAISNAVSTELKEAGLAVDRISGQTRYETAALIAERIAPKGADEVVIASGMDFPDALSVASHAANQGLPILLTQTNVLSKDTREALDSLGNTSTIVVGGPLAVSEKVEEKLPEPTRLSGDDRYETNVAINEYFGVESDHVYVATGINYADALTGAALAAKANSSVVLVHNKIPKVVSAYLTEQSFKRMTIFGGNIAVSEKVARDLQLLLN